MITDFSITFYKLPSIFLITNLWDGSCIISKGKSKGWDLNGWTCLGLKGAWIAKSGIFVPGCDTQAPSLLSAGSVRIEGCKSTELYFQHFFPHRVWHLIPIKHCFSDTKAHMCSQHVGPSLGVALLLGSCSQLRHVSSFSLPLAWPSPLCPFKISVGTYCTSRWIH